MSDIANFQLVVHCRKHGDELMYPTQAGAEEAARRMEQAMLNRGGRAWVAFAG